MKAVVLALFCLLTIPLSAQILEPVKWEMSSRHLQNDEYELVFTAKMDDNWSIYSQHTSDEGPVPTSFNFEAGDHYTRVGEVIESGGKKKEGLDPLFDVNVIKFVKGPVLFTQKVKVSDISKPITGYLEFMTCDDERCLPPTEVDFSFTVTPAENKKSGAVDPAVAAPTAEPAKKEADRKSVASDTEQGDDRGQILFEEKKTTDTDLGEIPPVAMQNDNLVDPVQWKVSIEKQSAEEYELIITATMQAGWCIYSQYLDLKEDEIGPLPTAIVFDEGDHYSLLGKTTEEGKKKEGMDPTFGVVVAKFLDEPVTFRQKIKVTDPKQLITGYVEYMTCDDKQCFPADFGFKADPATLQAGIDGEEMTAAVDVPVIMTSPGAGAAAGLLDVNRLNQPVGECGSESATVQGKGYWTIFFLGFIGGLLALLTPCVFPMIPLTVSFFTKGSENRKQGLTKAFLYGFSIFMVYLLLSIPFHLMDSVDSSILNQISTNVWLNLAFFVIFVFFAFSFFGYYEITLPSSWTNKASNAENVGGYLGIFFMALTLALVSFSCTGPILGSLLAGALSSSGGAMQLTMGMGGFGLALALPFALFAAFPAWLNSLPKSGGWLTTVKVVLGFVELALAFKFLSNADLTKHWGLLKYEVFLGIWILIAIGLALYLAGKIKFPHDSPLKKISLGRVIMTGLTIALVGYMALGFIYDDEMGSYKPLKLLSGLAPPSYYSWLHPGDCPQNLDCFKDLAQGLAYAKQVNKPVMLDFTGYNCVNCRKMEEHVWPEQGVYNYLKDEFVLISLYVDDRNPATGEDADKYRYIGKKWHKIQEEYFGANSQPYYVLISPESELLTQPVAYTPDPQEYSEFLRCGLETYKRLSSGEIKRPDTRIGSAE